jgi:hypothetical protein
MTPRIVILCAVILLLPIFVAEVAKISTPANQFLRANLSTNAGRIMISYSTILFCFMSGALWGFACKSDKTAKTPYVLAILPALFMLIAYSIGSAYRLYFLVVALILLLPIDVYMTKRELAPIWWLRFKLSFSIILIMALLFYQFKTYIFATLALA